MTDWLQAVAALLAGVYNCILTFEVYQAHEKWWRIIASAVTAAVLLVWACLRAFGL